MKNKQLKTLCEQAGMECSLGHWYVTDANLEKLVRLVAEDTALLHKLRSDVTTVSISPDTTQ